MAQLNPASCPPPSLYGFCGGIQFSYPLFCENEFVELLSQPEIKKAIKIIGVKNDLYCKIRNDLLNFKKITTSDNDKTNIIIMGYNTWLSIGEKPLPNRINIVIQNKLDNEIEYCDFSEYGYSNLYSYFSLKDVFDTCNNLEYNQIYIIGGASLYNETINKYQKNIEYVYHTLIDDNFDGILD